MSRELLICAVSVSLMSVLVCKVCACPPPPSDPDADIADCPKWVEAEAEVTFDGSNSKDTDECNPTCCCIAEYEWDFPAGASEISEVPGCSCTSCGSGCLKGSNCKKVTCKFNSVGTYTVKLKVQDDEGTAYKRNGTAVSEDDEIYPIGAYVADNSLDDDDADGIVDIDDDDVNVGGTPKENDMIKVHFEFDGFAGLNVGKVVIRKGLPIKLWRHEYKGEEIDFSYVGSGWCEKVYNLSNPSQKLAFENDIKNKDLWLEACAGGSILSLKYTTADDKTVCSDIVNFRVFTVYMDVYKRDGYTKVEIDKLVDPGACVSYNNDDDDADGIVDKDDDDVNVGGTPKEDDMIKVDFIFNLYFYYSLETGYVVLKRENTKIKLWKEKYKGGASKEIVFDAAGGTEKVYDLSDEDQREEFKDEIFWEEEYLWIEGYEASSALKDTGLTLLYRDADSVDVCVYPVNITVFDSSLTLYKCDGITIVEMDKEADPGAYIPYNNDDDDGDGNDTIPDYNDPNTPGEDETIRAHNSFGTVFNTLKMGQVVLKRENTKIKLWQKKHKGGANQEIEFDSAEDTEKVYNLNVPAECAAFASEVKNEDLWVEGYEPSTGLKDAGLTLIFRDYDGDDVCVDPVEITVVKVEVKNPVEPNKGTTNDSDDYFFRGPDEPNVKVYYDFLPTDVNASSVKLLIKEGGSTLRQISLSTTKGTNLLAEWNGKDASVDYYDKWDFRAVIEVMIGGETFTSNEHPIADLLYKHRPLMYVHDDELTGPQDVSCMMAHADLYRRIPWSDDEELASAPLDFDDLSGSNDATDRYQNLENAYRETNDEPNEVYCRGTIDSGYIFLQYWHFEPGSSLPDTLTFWHEGDWEMFQIAVEPNTVARELQPIAITGSQHYYGQTIRWDSNGFDNGPFSQDQDYVGKDPNGERPKVYIARESHATYFRDGDFRVPWEPGCTDNHGYQYAQAPTLPYLDDETGSQCYDYTLCVFSNSMISHWQGRWGQDPWTVESGYGARSPHDRSTAENMWTEPKSFNNYYLKLIDYDESQNDPNNWAHPETHIP